MKISKSSLAYQDFLNCKKVMKNSPDILIRIFSDIKNPHRPQEYSSFIKEYYWLSDSELLKSKIVYSIWNGSCDINLSHLLCLDRKDQKSIATFLS